MLRFGCDYRPNHGYSHNCKSKFGRRKPFLLIGSILMAIIYPMVWFASPDWTTIEDIYFLPLDYFLHLLYNLLSTYRALATEMTDYENAPPFVFILLSSIRSSC